MGITTLGTAFICITQKANKSEMLNLNEKDLREEYSYTFICDYTQPISEFTCSQIK